MSNEREAAKEFTKRPVKISARKWQKDGDHDHVTSLPGELWGETHAERYCKHCGMNKCNHGMIKTLEGGHIVCPGDWIIKGVKGEYYPCKPDIFDMTYTPAQQSAPASYRVVPVELLEYAAALIDQHYKGNVSKEIRNLLAAAPAQPHSDAVIVPRELRSVLAMILSALDRDAAGGKQVRGEMADELRALLGGEV